MPGVPANNNNKDFIINTSGTVRVGDPSLGGDLVVNGTTTTKVLTITGGLESRRSGLVYRVVGGSKEDLPRPNRQQ